jgi:hypothetical protein
MRASRPNRLTVITQNLRTVVCSLVDPLERVLPFAERDISLLWISNIQQLRRPEGFLELACRLDPCTARS